MHTWGKWPSPPGNRDHIQASRPQRLMSDTVLCSHCVLDSKGIKGEYILKMMAHRIHQPVLTMHNDHDVAMAMIRPLFDNDSAMIGP
jgi:hypothetical protein